MSNNSSSIAVKSTATDSHEAASQEVLAIYRKHLSRGRAKISEMFGTHTETSSKGAWVHTSNGEQYLNAGGYGVFIHGARHPHIERAVIEQIQTHPISSRILLEPQVAYAAKALADICPAGLTNVHFAGSGAEAAEAAIKLARTLKRTRLVTTINGYHGKTFGALSVTANALYQSPFEPLLPGVSAVPFGDAQALRDELIGKEPACVILEPIQGEGGVQIPPEGYLSDVRAICTEMGALLVLDEIQAGMGRTGRWWGADKESISADIMLVGKGLSGGIVPVSAMVATDDAFKAFNKDPFIHTSTFSGAPIAMAAARAAIEAIQIDGLLNSADKLGEQILQKLQALVAKHCAHLVKEVRGDGLLIGLEMQSPGLAGALIAELIDRKLIVNYSLNASEVIRLTPPAVMSQSDVAYLNSAFEDACIALASQYPTLDAIGTY